MEDRTRCQADFDPFARHVSHLCSWTLDTRDAELDADIHWNTHVRSFLSAQTQNIVVVVALAIERRHDAVPSNAPGLPWA